jgi:hypothetical protein
MTREIYYLIENKIYPKDLERYGCYYFSINKTFLDFTPLNRGLDLNPKKIKDMNIKKFHSLDELKLENIKNALIIDFLSNSSSSNKIRKILREKNKIVKRLNLYFSRNSILKKINLFLKKYFDLFNKNYFDILIVTGKSDSSYFSNFYAKKILYGNSYDFEKFENEDFIKPSYKYSVYLDEILFNHPDEKLLNTPSIENENFYTKLNYYFDVLEKKLNTKIVIAMHPKRNFDDRKFFQNRDVFYAETKELVRNSEFIIAHGSTSINFAIIYKKPIIILTNKKINAYYKKIFANLKKLIDCNLFDLDETENSFNPVKSINEEAYLKFFYNYISHPKSTTKITWSLLDNEINNKI